MTEKKKILVIADSPLVPSGVGTQTKYMIESLLKTGKYRFYCLAGAIRHPNYNLQMVEPWNDDWMIKPVDGYGNAQIIRNVISEYKPDVLWFMTDPRFYTWLWDISSEIRKNIPMVYYHVWDNYPSPMYNKKFYESNDVICTISKLTDDIVRDVAPNVKTIRIPHTVDTGIFSKKSLDSDLEMRKKMVDDPEDKIIFFWNNRNARRKQPGSLMFWFNEFLNRVGKDKAVLVMHTEPKDPNGQDLVKIIEKLNLTNGEIALSTNKLSPQDLAKVYSAVDCTVNISDAEGFGLSTLESLSCETPIIVNMTGGLQEQVTDGKNWFGIGLEPASKCVIGSQDVPYIYEDRINGKEFVDALEKFYNMSKQERKELGSQGRQHVLDNYGFEQYSRLWKETFQEIENSYGSWETRKNYKHWSIEEL